MKMINCASGLLLVFIAYTACAQSPGNPPQPKSPSANHTEAQLQEADTSSVPMSMIRHVRLARNGDILIASYLGVFRYDGKWFTNLTREIVSPRLSSFWDALEDRNGNLWLASKDSGIYCIRGYGLPGEAGGLSAAQRGHPARADVQHFTTEDGLSTNTMLDIYEDKAGNLWFGSTLYDGKTFRTLTTRDGYPVNHIRLLLEDSTGKRWFGAQQEDLFVYDGQTFTVLKDSDGRTFNSVWSVIEDKRGNIWFGANGLWRYDGRTLTKVSGRAAAAIIQDKKGNLWTTGGAGPNGGWALNRYDYKTLYDKNPAVTEVMSIKEGLIMTFVEANDGSIWLGGMGPARGVYRYDGKTFTGFRKNQPAIIPNP